MQYIGNSSPAWTIKEKQDLVPKKCRLLMNEKRDFDGKVGPGLYSPKNDLKFLEKMRGGYRFEHCERFPSTSCKKNVSNLKRKANSVSRENMSADKPKVFRKKKTQKYFTTSEREPLTKLNTKDFPGPGNYEIQSTLGAFRSPHISFGYKSTEAIFERTDKEISTGPGSYNPKLMTSVKGFKITHRKNFTKQLNKENSSINLISQVREKDPGITLHARQHSIKGTFAQPPRNKTNKKNIEDFCPGPGKYNVVDYNPTIFGNWKSRAFSLSGRLGKDLFPAPFKQVPHAYNINRNFYETAKAYSFPKKTEVIKNSVRNLDGDQTTVESEHLDRNFNKPHFIKGGIIGTGLRDDVCLNFNPGPGSYQPEFDHATCISKGTFIGRPAFTRKYKNDDDKDQDIPLLNVTYNVVDPNIKLGKFVQGRRDRTQKLFILPENNVKPTLYDVRQNLKETGFTFSRNHRDKEIDYGDCEIGPGFYDIKSTIPQLQSWIKIKSKFPVE